jgi:hypothetical protein
MFCPNVLAVALALVLTECAAPNGPRDETGSAEAANMPLQAQRATQPWVPDYVPSQRPTTPTVPRLRSEEVQVRQLAAQVYLEPTRTVAHRKACRDWRVGMTRTPLAAARMQGFVVHAACANLQDAPEFKRQMVVDPQWVEYEQKLADFEAAISRTPVQSGVAHQSITPSVPVSPDIKTEPAATSNRVVHVKGYTRKDGTYVPPHTRRQPTN